MKKENDYRRFLFRSSEPQGRDKLTALDVIDNMRGELERLHAVAELLFLSEPETIPPGTSELLRDIWERASKLLDLWQGLKEKKP
jgi:hypothetical protein